MGDDQSSSWREAEKPGKATKKEYEASSSSDIEYPSSPGDTAGELEGDGEAHKDNANVKGDLGVKKAKKKGGNDTASNAAHDDLGGADNSGDEYATGSTNHEGSEVECV